MLVLGVGTAAYKYIGGPQATLLDSLYMVVITVATIGYGEIIDLSHSPGGASSRCSSPLPASAS